MILKINDREYKVKYGYKALTQFDILSKVMKMSEIDDKTEIDMIISSVLPLLPELLLAGLQKYNDDFKFDYENESEKKDKLNMVYDLIDDYIDSDDGDEDKSIMSLFMSLTDELVNNGFLSKKSQMISKRIKKETQKK